jgi:hypothetical protein
MDPFSSHSVSAVTTRILLLNNMRIGWLVNENHYERAMSLRNGSHFPTTQCTCVDFEDFAAQCNGGSNRETDLYHDLRSLLLSMLAEHTLLLILLLLLPVHFF